MHHVESSLNARGAQAQAAHALRRNAQDSRRICYIALPSRPWRTLGLRPSSLSLWAICTPHTVGYM